MARVDQMEAGGQLDPAQAQRWRGILETGGNPFGEPTVNERQTIKGGAGGAAGGLTEYQQAMLGAQGGGRQDRADQEAYQQAKGRIATNIQALTKQLGSTFASEERQKLQQQLDEQLAALSGLSPGGARSAAGPTTRAQRPGRRRRAIAHPSHAVPGQPLGHQGHAGGAGDGPAAGQREGGAKPADDATINQYLRAAGYDAAKAEAAMKRDGYSAGHAHHAGRRPLSSSSRGPTENGVSTMGFLDDYAAELKRRDELSSRRRT